MTAESVTVRPATAEDADLLLTWANDRDTRAASFHPGPIDRPAHLGWLASRLASPTTRLMIGLVNGEPVGQVRLELADDGAAEVGIAVAPGRRGEGLGRRLLAAAIDAGRADRDLTVARFVARVRVENAASIRLFEGLGFQRWSASLCDGVPCVVYELSA